MSMTNKSVLILIAVILFIVSAFAKTDRVDLFKLAWAFAVLSLMV